MFPGRAFTPERLASTPFFYQGLQKKFNRGLIEMKKPDRD